MDNLTSFIKNPISGLFAGLIVGTAAGYQYGL
jgi:hypothetical protein